MHGTSQDVSIASQPTGANVTIDEIEKGTTPLTADLDRGDEHTVRIDMEGYQPYEMNITKSTSGWVWGNIVFGGLVGLAVDAITGGLYKLEPNQIEAELREGTAGAAEKDGKPHIRVVLQPDDDWEKVGQLDPHQSN